MTNTSLVLTILGTDRPGLVESLARVVADHDANWLESRMAHLAGHFAGILRVEVDQAKADALATAIHAATDGQLDTLVHPDATPAAPSENPLLVLDVLGHDRPGIIREITRVLSAAGVNVEELATETRAAPNTGQPLFHATAKLRLPTGADEASLRAALEDVAADLVVDVTLAMKS